MLKERNWLGVLLLLPCMAQGATYYVSPHGDDGNSGTQPGQEWRSISKANAAVRPGDTVFLRGGDYIADPIEPQRSGTESAVIRYMAYQGETPVLTSNRTDGLRVAIELSGRSYITIDGVHVNGREPNPRARVKHFVNIYNGSYNVIQNGTFRYATGWHGIRLDDGAHHNKILNNVLDFVGVYDDGSGQDKGDIIYATDTHHNLIEGNTLNHGAHGLINMRGRFNVIRNNIFDNDYSDVLGAGRGGRPVELMGRRNVFELNIVRNAGGSVDRSMNPGQKAEGIGNIVRRNLIYGNSGEGLQTETRDAITSVENHIFHNTIYNNGATAWRLEFFSDGRELHGNVFKNNILHRNRQRSGLATNYDVDIQFKLKRNPVGVTGRTIIESNLIDNGAMVYLQSGGERLGFDESVERHPETFRGNIVGAPMFVSSNPESAEDFDLTPTSPGVDQGAALARAIGNGNGRVVTVDDAGYFTDGLSLIPGDRLRIGGETAQVVSVDYDKQQLTVSRAISWQDGTPISLEFAGAAPDIGARELNQESFTSARPRPPQLISIDR